MKAALLVLVIPVLLVLLRRPLGGIARLTARSGLWLGFLWLFRGVAPLVGVTLGVNLFNAVMLGALGVPGLALMMMVQWLAK